MDIKSSLYIQRCTLRASVQVKQFIWLLLPSLFIWLSDGNKISLCYIFREEQDGFSVQHLTIFSVLVLVFK
jgi:hypothetical protein